MTTTLSAPTKSTETTATTSTNRLLAAGAAAGPLYLVVVLVQALTREGFDITKHPASLLANGTAGWVQTLNFVVSGLLTIAAAVGLRRTLTGRGRTWGPRLVAQYGVGLLLAACFHADPAAGFPSGTPADYAEISWHGYGHFVAGTIGFSGLIAACFVLAGHFRSTREKAWSRYSAITGTVFAVSFLGLMAGNALPGSISAFYVAVTLAWAWITALCLKFRP